MSDGVETIRNVYVKAIRQAHDSGCRTPEAISIRLTAQWLAWRWRRKAVDVHHPEWREWLKPERIAREIAAGLVVGLVINDGEVSRAGGN